MADGLSGQYIQSLRSEALEAVASSDTKVADRLQRAGETVTDGERRNRGNRRMDRRRVLGSAVGSRAAAHGW